MEQDRITDPASDNSIAKKLRRSILLISGTVLIATTIALVALDIYSYQQRTIQHLSTLSNIISKNSSFAITLEDSHTTSEIIATLQEEPMIVGAMLYTAGWNEISVTSMDSSTRNSITDDRAWLESMAELNNLTYQLTPSYLNLLNPVWNNGKIDAYLYIKASITPLYITLRNTLLFSLGLWIIIMAGVFIYSSRLQKHYTDPIQNLIHGMHDVSHQHDFTMRLPIIHDDEIGEITGMFNEMLGHIHNRDIHLKEYRDDLENIVEKRTKELMAAVDAAVEHKEIAEKANQAKSEFLATMSHEIRSPMIGVLGLADMMGRTELTEKQNKYVTTIQKSGELLIMLINDILDFSKIEAGQLELENRNFNVNELVEDIIDMLHPQATSKGLMLYHTINANTDVMVNGDTTRLSQILVNLIGNAIKFTETGKVSISMDVNKFGPEKKLLQFKISDTGIGIEPHKQQEIFNAFVQVDSSMVRRYGGSGLGLAISKKLVELMGGEIHIESELGSGTQFTFFVFVNNMNEAEISSAPETHRIHVEPENRHVLLVEDNLLNQEVAIEMLNDMGYKPDIAKNGDEAIEMAQSRYYDTILMDCQMPVKNGFDATREIRAMEKASEYQHYIIALTGNALIGDKDKCIEAGMDDFLSKPYSYDELRSVMELKRPV